MSQRAIELLRAAYLRSVIPSVRHNIALAVSLLGDESLLEQHEHGPAICQYCGGTGLGEHYVCHACEGEGTARISRR